MEHFDSDTGLLNTEMIEIPSPDGDDDTEKLNPNKNLEFKSFQYDLVTKYSQNLKNHNSRNLRVFFIIMSLENILQIILHASFKDELLEVKLRNSIRYNSYVKSSNLGSHRPVLLLFAVLPGYRHPS